MEEIICHKMRGTADKFYNGSHFPDNNSAIHVSVFYVELILAKLNTYYSLHLNHNSGNVFMRFE